MYPLKQVPSEAKIRMYLRRSIFGKNLWCPQCRGRQIVGYEARYRCRRCRTKFSLLSHTWLADLKLALPVWWAVLWCWTSQIPVRQCRALTQLSDEAVRRWYQRFRRHLPAETHILEQIVQMDEAYFRRWTLLIAKQRGTRRVVTQVLPGTAPTRTDAAQFLFQHVKPGSALWTDRSGIYQGIDRWWPVQHTSDVHRKFEFTHTSEVEGLIGNYRTFVRRMYHHHWAENLPEYVREFCFRFSSPDLFDNPQTYLENSLRLCTN